MNHRIVHHQIRTTSKLKTHSKDHHTLPCEPSSAPLPTLKITKLRSCYIFDDDTDVSPVSSSWFRQNQFVKISLDISKWYISSKNSLPWSWNNLWCYQVMKLSVINFWMVQKACDSNHAHMSAESGNWVKATILLIFLEDLSMWHSFKIVTKSKMLNDF